MINALTLFVFGIFFLSLIPLHEYIHYKTLKMLGYGGKLVFVKKVLGIGIKPIGVKENVVSAYDLILVLIMPLPFTFYWMYSAFTIISMNIVIGLIFGLLISLIACLQDIIYSIKLYQVWKKSIKFLKS